MTNLRAIIFLGNPGKDYAKTRHNAGFLFSETWSPSSSAPWVKKFRGDWAQTSWQGLHLHFLKPGEFMNLSGQAVGALAAFYKIPADHILVVHDEIELPFGEVQLRAGGGLAGHNGLRSIADALQTREFLRLRLGVGRPLRGDVASFVLSRFTSDEEISLPLLWSGAKVVLENFLLGETKGKTEGNGGTRIY